MLAIRPALYSIARRIVTLPPKPRQIVPKLIEVDGQPAEPGTASIRPSVTRAARAYRPSTSSKISCDCSPGSRIPIEADPERRVLVHFLFAITPLVTRRRGNAFDNDVGRHASNAKSRQTTAASSQVNSNAAFRLRLGRSAYLASEPNTYHRCFRRCRATAFYLHPPAGLPFRADLACGKLPFNGRTSNAVVIERDRSPAPQPRSPARTHYLQAAEFRHCRATCSHLTVDETNRIL